MFYSLEARNSTWIGSWLQLISVSKCSLLATSVQVPHLVGTGLGGKGVWQMLLIGLHSMWGFQKHFFFFHQN
jgi:hypothetical protein